MKVKGVGEFLVISPRGKGRHRNTNESSARLVNCTRAGLISRQQQTKDASAAARLATTVTGRHKTPGACNGGGGRKRKGRWDEDGRTDRKGKRAEGRGERDLRV
ncbi:hypothetical protein niasHS_014153 [Heterodera schachtii]|uniref:Uncharacterized protein n=1 Tax=Heterodera schachtii TaxID=97005 RepID=A0ABD2IQX8_HETSC